MVSTCARAFGLKPVLWRFSASVGSSEIVSNMVSTCAQRLDCACPLALFRDVESPKIVSSKIYSSSEVAVAVLSAVSPACSFRRSLKRNVGYMSSKYPAAVAA